MPIAEQDVTWVEEPKMGFWESTFLPAILTGLGITGRHVVDLKPVTMQYPEVTPDLPIHYKGVHRLNRDDQERVKCVACMMCATACPADCISIVATAAPKDDPLWAGRDKYPASFVIDELKCIYCGMCEEACPCDAIELTHIYDMTGLSRQEMLFDKNKLLSIYDQTKDHPKDPPRTHRGVLSGTSQFTTLPPLGPATPVNPDDRSAKSPTAGVIRTSANEAYPEG